MSLTKIIDADGNKKDINIFIEKVSTGGRPKKILTEEAIKLVENLARIMCTEEEIATILDVSLDTLHNKENDVLFRSAILKGRTVGKQSLRREQFRLAMKGNVKMLIWLGKQYLGQSDRLIPVDNEENNLLNSVCQSIQKIRESEDE